MGSRRPSLTLAAVVCAAFLACADPPPPSPTPAPSTLSTAVYPWLTEWSGPGELAPLEQRFPAPAGYRRVAAAPGSYAAWLRQLPTLRNRRQVLAHDGRPLPSHAVAVIALDVGTGDLQQCADTIIRLHAEHLWAAGRSDQAAYHFTSGDRSSWPDWVAGEVFRIDGNRVRRSDGPPRPEDHTTYRQWLEHLFRYAGTRSLALDSIPVPAHQPLAPGDLLVDPGSPGHAVVILDVAEHANRPRVALVGQGFMPAQELHVLGADRGDVLDGAWFPLPRAATDTLDVPSWAPFPRSSARRFVTGG